MLSQIKRVAAQTAEAGAPARFLFGEVTAADPLKIMVDSRFEISGDMLAVTREFRAGTMVKTAPMTAGDKVVLLRNQGGQQFLVLGRV